MNITICIRCDFNNYFKYNHFYEFIHKIVNISNLGYIEIKTKSKSQKSDYFLKTADNLTVLQYNYLSKLNINQMSTSEFQINKIVTSLISSVYEEDECNVTSKAISKIKKLITPILKIENDVQIKIVDTLFKINMHGDLRKDALQELHKYNQNRNRYRILYYIAAEILDQSINYAFYNKKKKITSKIIVKVIENDIQLCNLFNL